MQSKVVTFWPGRTPPGPQRIHPQPSGKTRWRQIAREREWACGADGGGGDPPIVPEAGMLPQYRSIVALCDCQS